MKFYDLQIFSHFSCGTNSPKDIVKTAEKLGYTAIAICDEFKDNTTLNLMLEDMKTIETDLEIIKGVTINPTSVPELKDTLSKVREKVQLIVVHGGNYLTNRAACEDSRVDILMHPELGRLDNGLDEACINAAIKNNVAFGISFYPILKTYRKQRSGLMQNISTNLKLLQEMGAKIVICSGAHSTWEMRAPRQLVAVVETMDLELSKGFKAMTETPLAIIEKNKKILAGEARDGVEVVD
jgi:ribonuclease P/MRP protein subunit RPP1